MNRIYIITFLALLSSISSASSLPDFPFVIVHGNSQIDVAPDKAILSLEVTEFNKNSEVAISNVFKRGNEIIQLALKNGVAKDDVKSSMYNKESKRDSSPDGQYNLGISGYEVSQSFTVVIENLEKYSSLVDSIASLQNVSRLDVDFYVKNQESLKEKLRLEASIDANKKAISLSSGLGQTLAGVFAITESSDFGTDFSGNFGISHEFVPPPSLDFVPDSGGKNMFIPKSIVIRSSVTVLYKIKPKT